MWFIYFFLFSNNLFHYIFYFFIFLSDLFTISFPFIWAFHRVRPSIITLFYVSIRYFFQIYFNSFNAIRSSPTFRYNLRSCPLSSHHFNLSFLFDSFQWVCPFAPFFPFHSLIPNSFASILFHSFRYSSLPYQLFPSISYTGCLSIQLSFSIHYFLPFREKFIFKTYFLFGKFVIYLGGG